MDTVVQAPPGEELHLLTDWGDPARRSRTGRAAVLSVLVHICAIVFVLVVPETFMQPVRRPSIEPLVMPLIEPLTVLTQKEPNTSKPSKTFNATDMEPRPRVHLPPGPPPTPAPAPAHQAEVVPPKPVAPPPLPEPPRIDVTNETPKLTLPVAPPQIQTEEKRPAFESVTVPREVPPDQRKIAIPGPSLNNVLRGVTRGAGGAIDPGVIPPGTPGGSELPQLLSDPQGVDFRPYLAQVLAAVKRSWNAITPESLKMGRRQVSLQVVILKDGSVGKVVYVEQTGVGLLDRAAVASISAASPFPELPRNFKGSEIRVQINFAYNVPKQ